MGRFDGFGVRMAARRWVLAVVLMVAGMAGMPALIGGPAMAQNEATEEELEKLEKRRTEAQEALKTLSSLLAALDEQTAEIEDLKTQLREAQEDATREELEAAIKAASEKQAQIEEQISALSTGVSAEEIADDQAEEFDLQKELASLAQPFIKMMRDATENARQIEKLKRTITQAEKRQQIAARALERLALLQDVGDEAASGGADGAPAALPHLATLREEWRKRESEAMDLGETARQQLTLRLDEQSRAAGLGRYATEFLRNRGLNLVLAVTAFAGVFLLMNLIAKLAGIIQRQQGIPRSFITRLASLLFKLLTIIAAFMAMLIVFNLVNDWLLLAIASVFALAMAWIGLKMLPAIMEQLTTLLNLGAVQEGERVMVAGVPWLVKRLDVYTDLVNPALDGGHFTLPVREMVGLHSRPAGEGEAWFPTNKGDWVQLNDETIGQVLSQTPELVQLRELGGSLITYETAAFLGATPRNLSAGYRLQFEFGLDYQHQAQATAEIPVRVGAFVQDGLIALLGRDGVRGVDVDLLRMDDSALTFEVEARIEGAHAPRYEDVEREIAMLVVGACNKHGYVIPFPQLVLHRAA